MYHVSLAGIDADGCERMYRLADFSGKRLVLYFYPKDNTSGCTQEACDFRDNMNRLTPYATVIGVSPDSIKSHIKFQTAHQLNFILLSDLNHELAQFFEVWKQKSMYGRTYMGIERTTFVIDASGHIEQAWRKVKIKGHVDEVLRYLTIKR